MVAEAGGVLTPPYRIETERLAICCWDPADAELLDEAVTGSLDHLRPWMLLIADEPRSLDQRFGVPRGGDVPAQASLVRRRRAARRDATVFSRLGEELSASPSARAPLRAYDAAGRPVELGASGTPAAG